MDARAVLAELEAMYTADFDNEERGRYETTRRALRLLAAAEANDGSTPETDAAVIQGMFVDADVSRAIERDRNGLAARVVELEGREPLDMSVCGVGRTPRSKP